MQIGEDLEATWTVLWVRLWPLVHYVYTHHIASKERETSLLCHYSFS